jgi:hypothetical protein
MLFFFICCIVAPLAIRVLQSESVPYTQQYGSVISTHCSITGTANTAQ